MNNEIKRTIAQLSDPEGLKYVCRRQEENHPMPSTEIINKIVKLLRSVIFPGYFGNFSRLSRECVLKIQNLIFIAPN